MMIEGTKSQETRRRRIEKAIITLREGVSTLREASARCRGGGDSGPDSSGLCALGPPAVSNCKDDTRVAVRSTLGYANHPDGQFRFREVFEQHVAHILFVDTRAWEHLSVDEVAVRSS